MDLEILNQAIEAAYQAAILNFERVAPHEIAPNVTLQTDTYVGPDGNGFMVICHITIPEANFTITKIRSYGPAVDIELDWPPEGIEAAVKAHVAQCIQFGGDHVLRYGFDADKKVILLNKLLKAKDAGNLQDFPKLAALYTWMEEVQTLAVNGHIYFPPPPYSFEEVITE